MKKRICSLFLAVVMLLGMIPPVRAADAVETYTYRPYPDATYELTYQELKDGTLEITGYQGKAGGELRLPDSINGKVISTIGNHAFWDAWGFEGKLQLPHHLTTIGEDAFKYTSFTGSLILPESVENIGKAAFSGMFNLERFDVAPNNSSYDTYDDMLVTKDGTKLIVCPAGKKGNIQIPNTVRIIGESAFDNCVYLTGTLNLPSSLCQIEDNAFSNCSNLTGKVFIPENLEKLGNYNGNPFCYCSQITEFEVAKNNPNFYSKDGMLFDSLDRFGVGNTLISCPEGKSGKVIIPEGTTILSQGSMRGCGHISSLTIPNTLKEIESYALPEVMTGKETLLQEIFYQGSEAQWNQITVGTNEILNQIVIHFNEEGPDISEKHGQCGQNLTWTLNDQGELRISGTGSMQNYGATSADLIPIPWAPYDKSIKALVIDSGVSTIGGGAFEGCSNLMDVTIPNSVNSIEAGSFIRCSSLKSVVMPIGMTRISDHAFFECSSLTSVTIPNSVTDIRENAFGGCTSLADVYYGGTEAEWQKLNYVFDHPVTIHYNSTDPTQPDVPAQKNKTVVGFIRSCDPFTDPATVRIDDTTYKVIPELFDVCMSFLQPENHAAFERDKVVAFVNGDTIEYVEQLKNITTSLNVSLILEDEELNYGKTGFIFRKGFIPESIHVGLHIENHVNIPKKEGFSIKEVLPYLDSTELSTFGTVGTSEIGVFEENWDSSVHQITGMHLKAGEMVETGLTLTPVKGYIPNQVRKLIPFTVLVNRQKKTIEIPVGNLLLQEEQAQKNKADREKEEAAQNPDEMTPEEYKKELKETVKKYRHMDSTVILPQNLLSIMTNKQEKEKLTELVSFWITSTEFVPSMEWIEDAKKVEKIQKQLQKSMYEYFDVKIENWLDKITHIFDPIQNGTKKSHITVQVSTKYGPQDIILYYQGIVQKFGQSSGEFGTLTWEPRQEGAIQKACINDYGVITESNIGAFSDDLMKMADKAIYHFYSKTAGAAIDEICRYVLSDFTQAVIKQICGSPSKGVYNLITDLAKKAAIKCPVDVYVYDAGGVLRGSIIDNQVQTTQDDLFLYTVGDEKYVWMLGDDYNIRLVGTDTGTMTYEIEEYAGNLETPTRTVIFQDIPLGVNTTYSGAMPEEIYVEQQKYALTKEGSGNIILPTEDDYNPGHSSGAESVPVINAVHGEFREDKLYVSAEVQDKEQNVFVTELYYVLNEELFVVEMEYQSENIWTATIDVPESIQSVHAIVHSSDVSANNTVSDSIVFERTRNEETSNNYVVPTEEQKDDTNSTEGFTDVSSNDYYCDAVLWAVEHSITTGVDVCHFVPDAPCTRAQAVTFLWRAAGSPKPVLLENCFVDVEPEDYFYDAVLWSVEQGITKGTSVTTFSPNENCSRAHIVTFLWRMERAPLVDIENPFADISEEEYFKNAVLWAVKEGITTGTSAETFSPYNLCTRAQAVTFLYRNQIQ